MCYWFGVLALLFSAATYSADFRGSSWGDTVGSVKMSDSAELVQEDSRQLVYIDRVSGLDFFVLYRFSGGELYSGSYASREKHTNKNLYISDYFELKALLTKKYGEPAVDDITWHNDLYQSNKGKHGYAVGLGHLSFIAKWDQNGTGITVALYGDNYSIHHMALYSDREASRQEADKGEAESLDML